MNNVEINKKISKINSKHNLKFHLDISERGLFYMAIVTVAVAVDSILAFMTLDKIFTGDAMVFTWLLTISFALIVDLMPAFAPSMIRKLEHHKKSNDSFNFNLMLVSTIVFLSIVVLTLLSMFALRHLTMENIFQSKIDEVFQNKNEEYGFYADFPKSAQVACIVFMNVINLSTTLATLTVGILRSKPISEYEKQRSTSYNYSLKGIINELKDEKDDLIMSQFNVENFDVDAKVHARVEEAKKQETIEIVSSHEDLLAVKADPDVSHLATEASEETLKESRNEE